MKHHHEQHLGHKVESLAVAARVATAPRAEQPVKRIAQRGLIPACRVQLLQPVDGRALHVEPELLLVFFRDGIGEEGFEVGRAAESIAGMLELPRARTDGPARRSLPQEVLTNLWQRRRHAVTRMRRGGLARSG